jgi:hypothetical protein
VKKPVFHSQPRDEKKKVFLYQLRVSNDLTSNMNHIRAPIYVHKGCRPQIYTPLHLTREKPTDKRMVSSWNMQWKYELCVKWVKSYCPLQKRLWLILGAFAKFRKVTISFVVSVCRSARNKSAPKARIFIKFYILRIFSKICRERSIFIKLLTQIAGTLHGD